MRDYLHGLIACLIFPFQPLYAQSVDGENIFAVRCAECHVQQAGDEIPSQETLSTYTANAVLRSITDGTMRLQGFELTAAERIAVAEFLSGQRVIEQPVRFEQGMCPKLTPLTAPVAGRTWTGWGNGLHNTRHQQETGGLAAGDVPNLVLRWAFGIPDVVQSRSQPAVYGGRLFMGSMSGVVYALDAESGCWYWTYKAEAGVRTAISIGEIEFDGRRRLAIFFSDVRTTAYALDAETGERLWSRLIGEHPASLGTGSPALHDGKLYVPVSGLPEEGRAGASDYECCTFRGSVTALDADTGEQIWKTYMIQEPQKLKITSAGTQLWGPAGAGVWSAPTIDTGRGVLYVSTGNAYAAPKVETSNAIMALDLDSGAIRWVNQLLAGDVWIFGCDAQTSGGIDPATKPNCPRDIGPDFDFSAAPVLTATPGGREVLIATQKSGMGYALDPDHNGRTLWQYRWGRGSAAGGVWGAAVNGGLAYFPVADLFTPAPGGLHAVDIATGKRVWYTPPQPSMCDPSERLCSPAQSAAATTIPGVVFSGSSDGGIRAFAAATGAIIWSYDTNREFTTVNGVAAKGASIDGPGVVVAGGMVYVTSGNGGLFGRPGNVLLAFIPQ